MLALLAALALIVGCAGAERTSDGPDVDAGTPLRFTATRSSMFDTSRTFRLSVINEGDVTVPLDAVHLDSPLFEGKPRSERDTEVASGQTLLIPLPYGSARCGPSVEDRPSEVVVVTNGVEVRNDLAEDPPGLLTDLHDLECAQARVMDGVDISFGEEWERTGPLAARGVIRLVPRQPDVVATVEEIRGNIVFGVRTPESTEPLLAVGTDGGEDEATIVVAADRCDTHALIESKKTFKYPTLVSLQGEEPVWVEVEPVGAVRRVFEDLITACIGPR